MTLSIIIVNYNVKYFLEHCLHSVRRAIKNIPAEIIIIDNCSSDESFDYLSPLFPEAIWISNKKNRGFGSACNQGLAIAKGTYILFLNPDTLVPEHCFDGCINLFKEHKEIGALGIRMYDGCGRFLKESKRGIPSVKAAFFKLSGISRFFAGSRFFDSYYMGHLDENRDHYAEILAGAFMMIPKSVLEETGSFDEAFFMYGEDVDLSYRIHLTGLKNYYLANPPIIHFKGESTAKNSLGYVKNFYRAMSIFVNKHYSGLSKKIAAGLIHAGIWSHAGLKALSAKLRSSPDTTPATTPATIIIIGKKSAAQSLLALLSEQVQGPIKDPVVVAPETPGLVSLLEQNPTAAVYLCEQDLSFSEMISIVTESRHRFIHFYSGLSIIKGG
ncbi:glycosyltransferase family 2 protein [Niabella ginsenosidivorans]|nr:glycosyltransferase family 2 protein [Niabella ginsenosidivorans]